MAENYNIFYSWQSDLPTKVNNYFIKECLQKAIKNLKSDSSLDISPRLDKDTKNKTGSPPIVDTIFKKIDKCQIFVCDVTIVNNGTITRFFSNRLMPNPNVMIELGYAIKRLGWDRIICINNNYFAKVEALPFDIKQNRITQYQLNPKESKYQNGKSKEKLVSVLRDSLKRIIENYDSILEEYKRIEIDDHDRGIFRLSEEIISGQALIELIDFVGNCYFYDQNEMKKTRDYAYFLKLDQNQFLTEEIKLMAEELVNAIENMLTTCGTYMGTHYKEILDEGTMELTTNARVRLLVYSETNMRESEEEYLAYLRKVHEKIGKDADNVIAIFKEYRSKVKKNLMI